MTPTVERLTHFNASVHTAVAIVGGGACGLTAALTLHQLGIDCVVLERDALPTGSTALSSGFVPAAGTHAQHAQGIDDSPAQFAQDIQAKAHGRASPVLVDAYSRAIGPAIDALAQHHGIHWQVLDTFLYPGHSVHRMHTVPEKTGSGLMTRLHSAADAAGVVVLTEAQVCTLYVNHDDQILGLGFLRPDGQLEQLSCNTVLLACNGFGGNTELVKTLLPEMRDALYAGHTGNDGSAIQWGQQLGAHLADLGGYQGHGSWAIPQGALISWALMMEGAIQVNAQGQRFHDETQGYSEAAVHVLAQPGGTAWNVFDDTLLSFAQDFPDFCEAQAAGAVHHFADVAALAQHIGCDAKVLNQTLQSVCNGVEPLTGRHFKRPLVAPLHAVRVTGALFHTQGGLDINAKCQVLRPDGRPLPNLLAAGGAARGVSGDAVWGYLSGNGLLSAIAGGYIAAHTAAHTTANPT
ncbi:MAG: FAD-dependent oxidoreductase [Limnohabitans sp.]|nr:FAD-dependent oxidoreductase [Limnohabitans sp.]